MPASDRARRASGTPGTEGAFRHATALEAQRRRSHELPTHPRRRPPRARHRALIFGLNATDSFSEKVTEGVTGKYTDETTWFILGGIALSLVGGALVLVGGGRTRSA